MPPQKSVTCLGCMINDKGDPKKELAKRIADCMTILDRLDQCWKHVSNPTKWKIRVYDAVVRSKLMYGLESVQLNDSLKKKLDVFQLKGLRKILGLNTTFITRANTNELVYTRPEDEMNEGIPSGSHRYKKLHKLSEYYEIRRRHTTLGLIKNRDRDDPRVNLTMQPENLKLREYPQKRVGRPKNVWWHFALKEVWSWMGIHKNTELRAVELDLRNSRHLEHIKLITDTEEIQ